MKELYKLITPTESIVKQYNDFWSDQKQLNSYVLLFQESSPLDVYSLIPFKEFYGFCNNDKTIMNLYLKRDFNSFFKMINTVYSTRVPISRYENNEKWLEMKSVEKLANSFGNKTYYSFATKVFSFIDPKSYPIYDKYVSALVWYYLSEKTRSNYHKEKWHNYDIYVYAFNEFINQYGLNNLDYKQIDIFLWTYSKLLIAYWRKQGVIFL